MIQKVSDKQLLKVALVLWPIGMAFLGFDLAAIAFPQQTLPQIVGVCLGWLFGFWSLAVIVRRHFGSRGSR